MKYLNLKTIIFTLLFGLLFNSTYSQEIEQKPISQIKLSGFNCDYLLDGTDGYIFCGYQNPKYSSIIDILSLYFDDKETVTNLIKDLESSLTYLGTNQTVRYTKNKNYIITIYDFNKTQIYLGNQEDEEWKMNKKDIIKYIDWLKSLDLKHLVY